MNCISECRLLFCGSGLNVLTVEWGYPSNKALYTVGRGGAMIDKTQLAYLPAHLCLLRPSIHWHAVVSPRGGGGGGGGTPYVMGDTYVPRFWPPFFTLAGSSTIFLGYFFSSTNSKAIFWGTKTTNFYKNRSFWPQIQFFPRSFWVQFSAASGTPPSVFRPSTPPRECLGVLFQQSTLYCQTDRSVLH